MDSLMPNMNGIDATRIIIKELKFPNPVIAVTGNMLPEDVRDFESAGVLTVLGKPLELDKLSDILRGKSVFQIIKVISSSVNLECVTILFLLIAVGNDMLIY
jgi:CheY-like chemotaxis protein